MKIKELWISEYKNIKDLNLKFQSNLISLLVGKNGLGKSNLIEILALIFRDLDILEDYEDFKSWPYDNFEYNICYECKESEITIICKEDDFRVFTRSLNEKSLPEVLDFNKFKNQKRELYLPKYIIGYYSGENKRIRNIVRPYEKKIWENLKKNIGLEEEFRRLFFAENYHAQMVLVTLLLYNQSSTNKIFNEKVKYLIEEFTSIKNLSNLSIELKNPLWYNLSSKTQANKSIFQLEENLLRDNPFPFWNAKGKADKIISFLYNNSKSDPIYYIDDADKTERLNLNNIDSDLISKNIHTEFGHAINFFDAFESLFQIEVLENIILSVSSKTEGVAFNFTELSEGEQQIITVLGLILITGKDDCLFLLDEPDTHLNPLWQRDYVSLLREFNLNDYNSHIIVATHSPLIVQAAEDADIFLYISHEDGRIEISNDEHMVPNWRIDQVLTSEYFDLPSARPAYLDEYMQLRSKIISESKLDLESDLKLTQLENEFGVLPTGETRDEIEALLLIKKITDRYKNNHD